jgi:hypothetical protein
MTGYLLVPMDVRAMVVNDAARQLNYRRWTYSYDALPTFDTPEQSPWDSQSGNWSRDPSANGVYLFWTLPAALRQGAHDSAAGATTWPLVPNRWLVVRYSGPPSRRQAAGWVVESDFIGADGTSPYLDPTAGTAVSIGRRIDLATGSWSETGKGPLFLTAVAPGNPAFASFQPNTENVFSIHDSLGGVAAGTLAYAVMGWYSDPADDILRKTGKPDFAAALDALGWALPKADQAGTADTCVVHGLVRGIGWDPKGAVPAGGRPTGPSEVCVSLAGTSIDALTATVTQQIVNSGRAADYDPRLLEAFQYGLVSSLDQPDGAALLEAQLQQAGFLRSPGGIRWEIVDAPADSPAQAAARRTQAAAAAAGGEEAWLAALNQAQAAYEAGAADLTARQWELYSMWWKRGWATNNEMPDGCSDDQFSDALKPAPADSLLSRAAAKLAEVASLQAAVPHGDTPEQFQASIRAYAAAHNLPASRVLQPAAGPSFWEQANPVIVVSGAKAGEPLTSDAALACRLPGDIVAAITYQAAPGGAITPAQLPVPTVPITGMPAVLSALIDEFFLIDPDNAAAVAGQVLHDAGATAAVAAAMADPKAMRGVPPAVALGSWAQPWAPLFLLWELRYCPVGFGGAGTQNWTFDGNRYRWNGTGAAVDKQGHFVYHTYSGYSLLTPKSVFTLRRRLQQYAKDNPLAPLAQVEAFIEQTDGWDFLSQSLEGLHQQLALRDPVAVVGPDASTIVTGSLTIAQLVGDADVYLPQPGPPQTDTDATTAFQPVRSGLAYLSGLVVVDAFGQTFELVTSTTSAEFRPVLDPELLPDKSAGSYEPNRMIQLRPRLTQPARLRLDFVSATDDGKVFGPDEGVDPVCGWLILNHLDASLTAYSPAGQALGELRVVTTGATAGPTKQVVAWNAAPGAPYPTLPAVTAAFPHLGQALTGMQGAGTDAFDDVLQMIDESLWGIVPGGLPDDQAAAVLAGRPLALVRVRAALELNGPPLPDPTWRLTFAQPPPAVLGYDFPVRIGDPGRRGDGLIGYFTGSDYTQFNVALLPNAPSGPSGAQSPGQQPASHDFLVPIGPGHFVTLRPNGDASYLTMLVDPRAPVHAISDILPVTSLSIPPSLTDPAIGSMALLFDISPALTVLDPGAQSTAPSVAMPTPATRDFNWSWLEPGAAGAVTILRTVPPAPGAAFPTTPPTLRSGWLRLSRDPDS